MFNVSQLRTGEGISALDAAKLTGTLSTSVLPSSGVIGGTYGNASNTPQLVIDASGRVTSATNIPSSSVGMFALLGLSTPTYATGTNSLAWSLVSGNGITLESSTNLRIANAGTYKFEMALNSDHTNTGGCFVTLESFNGTTWSIVQNYDTDPGTWNDNLTLPFIGMVQCTSNQLWRLRINNSTNATTTWGTGQRYSRCMIYKVA